MTAHRVTMALDPPKLDPYQEWLIPNQNLPEAEEEEPTPTVEGTSVAATSDVLTPATPPLVQSPASSISSAAERTIQVTDISDPLPQKFSGNLDAWFDSAAPAPNVAVHGVYNVKAFEYVELANPYTLEYVGVRFSLDLGYFFLVCLLSFLSIVPPVFYERCTPMFQDDLIRESESCSSFPSRLSTLYIII